MKTRTVLATLAILGCASGALGQTMSFSLSASQTEVNPDNPSIYIDVYASWDEDPPNIGFASGDLDLIGISNWDTGTIVNHIINPLLYQNDVWGDDEGELQPDNDLLGATPHQIPPFFNSDFDASNPIYLLTLEWETDDFTPREVCLGAFPLSGYVYLDEFGTSVSMDVQGQWICFNVEDSWCPGDFNNDGNKDSRDVLEFLAAWNAGDRRADWNQDGTIDTRDVLLFINDWLTLC